MTDRDRLIELLMNGIVNNLGTVFQENVEPIADYLLANGVIAPPCKVDDSIFRVANGEIWEWLIAMAYVHPDEIIYVDDSENEFTAEDIGKTVFLTKEEAESELRKRSNDNA